MKMCNFYMYWVTCIFWCFHVPIECRVIQLPVIRFWQSVHQMKAVNVFFPIIQKLLLFSWFFLLWLVAFWKIHFYMFFLSVVLATSNGHSFMLLIAHLQPWKVFFQSIYNSPVYSKYVSHTNVVNFLTFLSLDTGD